MQPNIIIITTDQQRYDALHCNGSDFIQTPNLDRLANMGVRFERGYCTNPVCTPSRVSIMTGMHISEHGSYNIGTVPKDINVFLSSVLTREGYQTHHIGKAHFYPSDVPSEENKPCNGIVPFTNFAGFQTAELTVGHNDWGVSSHYKEWLKLQGYDKNDNPNDFIVNMVLKQDAYATGEFELPLRYHSSSWIVSRVEHFLNHLNTEQPFYLNIGFQDPHHPHVLPKDFNKRIDKNDIPKPSGEFDERLEHLNEIYKGNIENSRFAGTYRIAGNQNTKWCDYFKDEEKTAVTRSHYYSMVQLLDEQVGKIIDMIENKNLLQNSILIFTSDHGEMLGNHRLGQKGPMAYEDVIRVPFIFSYPNQIEPATITKCVSLADIYPTILEYVGVDIPSCCTGISLKQLFEENRHLRKGVRVEFKEDIAALRYKCWVTEEWKIVIYMEEEFGELYHLGKDPKEKNNLYDNSMYRDVKFYLTKQLLEDMERCEKMNKRISRC